MNNNYNLKILFGPPGTGKTKTITNLVETLLLKNKNIHILVTAPSNTAADVICSRLIEFNITKNQMLRLNAINRSQNTITDPKIHNYCL